MFPYEGLGVLKYKPVAHAFNQKKENLAKSRQFQEDKNCVKGDAVDAINAGDFERVQDASRGCKDTRQGQTFEKPDLFLMTNRISEKFTKIVYKKIKFEHLLPQFE